MVASAGPLLTETKPEGLPSAGEAAHAADLALTAGRLRVLASVPDEGPVESPGLVRYRTDHLLLILLRGLAELAGGACGVWAEEACGVRCSAGESRAAFR